MTTPPTEPVLVYDGDCGFCTRCVRLLAPLCHGVEVLPWQFADLPALGLTEEQAAASVQWVDTGGRIHQGHEAVAALLVHAGLPWSPMGRGMLLPGVSWVCARLYELVSRNRHRLPGSTPACRLPPERRPGARPR